MRLMAGKTFFGPEKVSQHKLENRDMCVVLPLFRIDQFLL
jgi:hypothetical protein